MSQTASKKLLEQIADASSDPKFAMGLTTLPNPDEVLRKAGLTHAAYDQVLTDSHVISKVIDRRAGMLRKEWRVEAGDDSSNSAKAAQLCEKALAEMEQHEDFPLENSLGILQDAVFRGHRAVEVVWKYQDYWYPDFLRDIPGRRLIHSGKEWRLLTESEKENGISFPDKKILMATHMATYDNPYGEALLSRCYWPYMFKHSGLKWWVTLAEKYGLPWVIGMLGGNAEHTARRDLLNNLVALVVDAVAVLPRDADIKLENDAGVSPDVHEKLVKLCNNEISKVLVGQTLSTEISGTSGSRAAAETHSGLRDEIVEADSKLVARVMNRLFGWITEINFKDKAASPRFVWVEEDKPNETWARVAGMAIKNLPGKVPLRWAYEKYGIPEDMKDEEMILPEAVPATKLTKAAGDMESERADMESAPTGIKSGRRGGFNIRPEHHQFSSGVTEQQQGLEELAELGLAESTDLFADNEEKIIAAVQSAESYEEAMENLLELWPDMETGSLEDLLQRVFFASDMYGRFTAGIENGGEKSERAEMDSAPTPIPVGADSISAPLTAAGEKHER